MVFNLLEAWSTRQKVGSWRCWMCTVPQGMAQHVLIPHAWADRGDPDNTSPSTFE